MRQLLFISTLTILLFVQGCANHIRITDGVIWDSVPNSERISLDEKKLDGAVMSAKIRFLCWKRQYSIINEIETPYIAPEELYEVPVGLVTWPLSMLWWITTNAVSLGSAEGTSKALDWSTAGLNPLLNVEYGMFGKDRYIIKEKKGSRREQTGSEPEPYDAIVTPDDGKVKVRFENGTSETINVGDEVLLIINLIEIARIMPNANVQKIIIEVMLKWNAKAKPVTKNINVFIDKNLGKRLFALKGISNTLMTTSDLEIFKKALDEVQRAGFSREAAMIEVKRKGDLVPLQK